MLSVRSRIMLAVDGAAVAAEPREESPVRVPGGGINQAGEVRSARVESIRALAALAVLSGHALESAYRHRPIVLQGWHRLFESGGFGVYVFFCLSGYLLFRPFVRQAWGDGGEVSLRRYAVNRVLRILPLYYAVFLVYVFIRQHGGSFDTWWRFLLILPNYRVQTLRLVEGGMWSIVFEVEFYIVLPLIAWLIAQLAGRSLRNATLIVAAGGVLLYLLHFATVNAAAHPSRSWFHSLPATFVFFVPGMLLALLQQHLRGHRPTLWRGPLAYADTWLLAAAAVMLLVVYEFGWSGRDGLILVG